MILKKLILSITTPIFYYILATTISLKINTTNISNYIFGVMTIATILYIFFSNGSSKVLNKISIGVLIIIGLVTLFVLNVIIGSSLINLKQ